MIQIANPVTQPSLTFNQIFLKSFVLTQDDTGKKNCELVVKAATTDANGNYVFTGQEQVVQIQDFDTWMVGCMATQLGSVAAVEAAYAAAKANANTMTIIDAMAAFQAGIARICAAENVYQVQSVA